MESQGADDTFGAPIDELMEALDSYIPTPERAVDKDFLMSIEDVFSIKGRGTVVTGRVEQGVIKTGEDVEIVGIVDTVKVNERRKREGARGGATRPRLYSPQKS